MLRLPASIERKLEQLFPKVSDRNRFVADVVTEALQQFDPQDAQNETHVGGTLHLFTDGGSRGNPGQAAIGVVLEDPARGEILREHYERIGIETNNVAEYRALIEGLKIAKGYHPNRLVCHLDSELIVKQLNGEYQVKMPTLQAFVEEIREIMLEISDVTFKHIPRNDNFRADALVNKALDQQLSPHYVDPRK